MYDNINVYMFLEIYHFRGSFMKKGYLGVQLFEALWYTSRKVADSIPAGHTNGPMVDSTCNRNEYR
jgi:hypothetical protein